MYVVQLYVSQYVLNNIGHINNNRGKKKICLKQLPLFMVRKRLPYGAKEEQMKGGGGC